MQGSNILRWLPRLRVEPGISNKIDQGRSLDDGCYPVILFACTRRCLRSWLGPNLMVLPNRSGPGIWFGHNSSCTQVSLWPHILAAFRLFTCQRAMVSVAHPKFGKTSEATSGLSSCGNFRYRIYCFPRQHLSCPTWGGESYSPIRLCQPTPPSFFIHSRAACRTPRRSAGNVFIGRFGRRHYRRVKLTGSLPGGHSNLSKVANRNVELTVVWFTAVQAPQPTVNRG